MTDKQAIEYQEALRSGFDNKSYQTYQNKIHLIESDKDVYGKTIENSRKVKIINSMFESNMTDRQKEYLYNKEFEDTSSIKNAKIPIDEYLKFQKNIAFLKGNEDTKNKYQGVAKSGSKKDKVLDEIVKLNIDIDQKLLLTYLSGYTVDNNDYRGYNKYTAGNKTFDYIASLPISYSDKEDLLKKAGYKKLKNGNWGGNGIG